MKKIIKDIIKNISSLPWIYKFLDKNSKIIYIWKSINLKNRVNSYFNPNAKLNFAKKKMVVQIINIETIITNNETESLILETTLIKKHKPKYNILMKDDKNHLYIKITDELFPKIIKTRIKNKYWTYFWPYISTGYVNNVLKFIKKYFWYRDCNLKFINKDNTPWIKSSIWTKIPCIEYYIKRCSWPCLLEKDNMKEYSISIEKIKEFLWWKYSDIIKYLEIEMKKNASILNFEKAKEIQELIKSIIWMNESQIVRDSLNFDYDIINFIEKYEKTFIWLLKVRDNKIVWFFNYEIETKLNETIKDIIKVFIERKFAEYTEKNLKIRFIIPNKLKIKDIIIETPQIWTKIELLNMCYKNIYEFAHKKHINSLSTKGFTKATMKNLLKILDIKEINKDLIFECNDISHLSWNYVVASRSVIKNWKKEKFLYRKFKIKTLEEQKIDDFWSLKEIIYRRLKEIINLWNLPDLIIIDGWLWQLSSVIKIVANFKKTNIDSENIWLIDKLNLISIAKRNEEIYVPNDNKPIVLKKESLELRLVQEIRDESHRFAITFNRDLRVKNMKKNILEELPWFWPKTRKKILSLCWNVDNLKNIKKDELKKILNKIQIETLEWHWLL